MLLAGWVSVNHSYKLQYVWHLSTDIVFDYPYELNLWVASLSTNYVAANGRNPELYHLTDNVLSVKTRALIQNKDVILPV